MRHSEYRVSQRTTNSLASKALYSDRSGMLFLAIWRRLLQRLSEIFSIILVNDHRPNHASRLKLKRHTQPPLPYRLGQLIIGINHIQNRRTEINPIVHQQPKISFNIRLRRIPDITRDRCQCKLTVDEIDRSNDSQLM